MQLFYYPEAKTGSMLTLDKQESAHIVRVLRMQQGDMLYITDGRGSLFSGKICDPDPKKVRVCIDSQRYYKPRDFSVHIALAPTKNIKRTEWFVEKAVEIGVEKISFFHSRHAERKSINSGRIEKIAIAAMKQSVKYHLPETVSIQTLHDVICGSPEPGKWIAHCFSDLRRETIPIAGSGQSNIVLIGPEGGFHKEEVLEAEQHGFTGIELSPYRLRTETAALIACQWLNMQNMYQV
ncbi:MAG: RsmE family RNA methyltransferase [Bacteroidales bacterium]